MKNFIKLAALCGFFIAQNAFAVCSNYKTFTDGSVLTAGELNSLQTNYTNCTNNVLDGDIFTGNITMNGGSDLSIYSDTSSTLKGSIDGATGTAILAVKSGGFISNLNLKAATTTNANDSIKIECGNDACSATNPGFVWMPDTASAGDLKLFTITSDVTLVVSGSLWGKDNYGNVTGSIIRVSLVNDNSSNLRTCLSIIGGRQTYLTTDTTASQAGTIQAEKVLCDTAVGSASNTVLEIGYFRADYTDATDVWAVQSGVNDIVIGESPDGLYQPWNPDFGGFSVNPTTSSARWTQHGRMITVVYSYSASGTSNNTSFNIVAPVPAAYAISAPAGGNATDNGAAVATTVKVSTSAGSRTLALTKDQSGTAWTNVNAKGADIGNFSYEAGPAASFIE